MTSTSGEDAGGADSDLVVIFAALAHGAVPLRTDFAARLRTRLIQELAVQRVAAVDDLAATCDAIPTE